MEQMEQEKEERSQQTNCHPRRAQKDRESQEEKGKAEAKKEVGWVHYPQQGVYFSWTMQQEVNWPEGFRRQRMRQDW